jgi:hypothetical protein
VNQGKLDPISYCKFHLMMLAIIKAFVALLSLLQALMNFKQKLVTLLQLHLNHWHA